MKLFALFLAVMAGTWAAVVFTSGLITTVICIVLVLIAGLFQGV